jgi:hypothetical protein
MTRTAKTHIMAALVAVIASGSVVDAHHSRSVRVPLLEGITVDGELDDWPSSLPRYSFDRSHCNSQMRSASAGQHRPGAFFMTGYDPDGVLFVAVQVKDDDLVVGDAWDRTDGVEVYAVDQAPRMPVTGIGMFQREADTVCDDPCTRRPPRALRGTRHTMA